jgi:hypothetical protein
VRPGAIGEAGGAKGNKILAIANLAIAGFTDWAALKAEQQAPDATSPAAGSAEGHHESVHWDAGRFGARRCLTSESDSTGLIGFDVETVWRTGDRSCSDSLNGAPKEAPMATSLSPPDLVSR